MLHVAGLWVVACYVATPFTWYTGEPRYLYCAAPIVALALAAAVPKPDVGAAAVVALLAVTTAGSLSSAADRAVPTWQPDLAAVAAWLQGQGIDAAYADYRTAYTLSYVSGGRIATVPLGGICRFPDRVAGAERYAYVLPAAGRDRVPAFTTATLVVVLPSAAGPSRGDC